MKKSRMLLVGLLVLVVASLLIGCKGEEGIVYEDGTYFAMQDEFSERSGWKYAVIITVEDGKFTEINWTAISNKGGLDKDSLSREGLYPMVEIGNAKYDWHIQAEKTEAHLLETQDITDIEYSPDTGRTDAISGVSITINGFYEVVEKALNKGPVEPGRFRDGAYQAEEDSYTNGWRNTVAITVLHGNIVSAHWTEINEENPEIDKKTESIDGNYPMVEDGGAKAPWHEQVEKTENHLIASQDPTDINFIDDRGRTDAITGVSIMVKPFFALAEEALADAK